jgi:hypothetical protein
MTFEVRIVYEGDACGVYGGEACPWFNEHEMGHSCDLFSEILNPHGAGVWRRCADCRQMEQSVLERQHNEEA